MSATLIIRDKEASWLPRASLFELIVNRIADQLQDIDTKLAQVFYESVEGQFILDLTDLDQQQFSAVFEASQAAHEKIFHEWIKDDVPAYQVYGLSELKAMLSLDTRSGGNVRETIGTMTIREGAVWQNEGWAYDLLIEFLATLFPPQSESTAQRLLRGRTSVGNGFCDLSTLDETEFQVFIEPVDMLKKRFIDMRIRDGFAPEMDTVFFPNAILLYEAFRSDPRIKDKQWPE